MRKLLCQSSIAIVAFISYSHADAKEAKSLHERLEAIRDPADRKNRLVNPVFRDEAELGATTDLGSTIQGALEESEALIVLVSRASLNSTWVKKEVDYFLSNDASRKVLFVLSKSLRSQAHLAPDQITNETRTSEPYLQNSRTALCRFW